MGLGWQVQFVEQPPTEARGSALLSIQISTRPSQFNLGRNFTRLGFVLQVLLPGFFPGFGPSGEYSFTRNLAPELRHQLLDLGLEPRLR